MELSGGGYPCKTGLWEAGRETSLPLYSVSESFLITEKTILICSRTKTLVFQALTPDRHLTTKCSNLMGQEGVKTKI